MRKQLWLACVVCVVGVFRGLFVGELAATIWRWSAESFLGSEPDVYFLRTLFGIETPGEIIKWIVFKAIPSGVTGGVAGAIAVKLTELICRGCQI